jgi:FkbM family methyltransferase
MASLVRLMVSAQLALLRRLVPRLTPGDRSYLGRTLMLDRMSPETRALAELFDKAILSFKNKQYAVELNGEEALLGRLKPFAPKLLLDVGANIGEWSLAAHRQLPGVAVHAFEIAPPTAAILTRNLREAGASVTVNDFGLGDRDGEITLHFTPDYTLGASTVRGAMEYSAKELGIARIEEIAARITTGDAYLAERGIAHVDLLKIDVEGAEDAVFRGFEQAFARGTIDLVQFEYGPLSLSTRYFLADAAAFFALHGYVLGKLYPEGVAFKPFEAADEDFVGPNYVACREARADLIAALRCPAP